MGGVLPKVSIYAFLSVVCLLINISLFFTGLIDEGTTDTTNFLKSNTENIYADSTDDYTNKSAGDFAIATGGAFIPFYSLLTISDYFDALPLALSVVIAIVVGIISAFQLFLLSIIILNMIPKVLGSGFDV